MKVYTARELGMLLLALPYADHRVVHVVLQEEPYAPVIGVKNETTGDGNPVQDGVVLLFVERE